ncbi:MAG: hypothetical protein ABII88_09715 [Candidatus Omnitrophota bacterium]
MRGRRYSKVRTSDSITGADAVKGWATMDLSLNYNVKDWDSRLTLTNVLDKAYEVGGTVTRPLARPGRAVEISLGHKF